MIFAVVTVKVIGCIFLSLLVDPALYTAIAKNEYK